MTVTNRHIDPILLESTPGGLLRSTRLLPEGVGDWTGGIVFTSNCGGANTWGCTYSDEKTILDKGDPVEFDPFFVYGSARCSGAPDVPELTLISQIRLRRGMSGALANELYRSNPDVANPDLETTAVDITPGASPCIDKAIAGLLSTAADCGGGDIVIHAPLVALASLMSLNLVDFSDGRYRIGGHTIVVDSYPNEPPTGGAAAGANQAWLYSTGPVEYRLGETVDVQQFTGRTNESIVLAEQLAILRFDPCCVYAILADIC